MVNLSRDPETSNVTRYYPHRIRTLDRPHGYGMYEEPNNDRKGDQADGAAEGKERKRRVPAAVPLSIEAEPHHG